MFLCIKKIKFLRNILLQIKFVSKRAFNAAVTQLTRISLGAIKESRIKSVTNVCAFYQLTVTCLQDRSYLRRERESEKIYVSLHGMEMRIKNSQKRFYVMSE